MGTFTLICFQKSLYSETGFVRIIIATFRNPSGTEKTLTKIVLNGLLNYHQLRGIEIWSDQPNTPESDYRSSLTDLYANVGCSAGLISLKPCLLLTSTPPPPRHPAPQNHKNKVRRFKPPDSDRNRRLRPPALTEIFVLTSRPQCGSPTLLF